MSPCLRSSCSGMAFTVIRMPLLVVRMPRGSKRHMEMKMLVPRANGRTLASVGACSAILGPLLDNYHSQFGILAYKHPVDLHMNVAGLSANFTTAPFTSPLFVLAGLVIAYGTLIFDSTFVDRKFPVASMSGPKAMATIAAFSSIYYLSAVVPRSEFAYITGPLLTLLAYAEWYFMDKSIGGLMMGLLTGLCGPLLEVQLINIGGLYSYSSPEILGIPLFIAPVYFAGAPAVGNLARLIDRHMKTGTENCKS